VRKEAQDVISFLRKIGPIEIGKSDAPPGTVVQVLQRGYKSGDRLLRPAMVIVAKAAPLNPPE